MTEPPRTTPFRTTRRVEFSDTDAAGIVHFAAFFRYMEQAEHELLRSVGLSVHGVGKDGAEGKVSWPRVSARCDYRSPAKFEDVLEIAVSVARLGDKSVTYRFDFRLGEQALASGEVTAVCCRFPQGGPPQSVAIPDSIRTKLTPFLETDPEAGV